jgi:tRNA threonylcarbamoyladenosine biosynthesis protein TsaB
MTILGLDTTGEFGSTALLRDGTIIAETYMHSPDGFAHVLFPELSRLLERGDCGLQDVDCFAAASGPGSFTGVRVGLTAVKGLAEATAKPMAAISNLRALATFGRCERRAVIMDARRGEVYAAVYDASLRLVSPEVVTRISAWLENLDKGEYEFITVAGAPFREALSGTRFAAMPWTEAPRSLAPGVVICAERDAIDGKLLSPLAADANYVRSSDAELFWRDR